MSSVEMAGKVEPKKWRYRGGQILRGGGEFYGDDGMGLKEAMASVGLSSDPPKAQAAADALDSAFAALRGAANAEPAVMANIELLQAELGKGAQPASTISPPSPAA